MFGVLNINKPAKMTSHDVISYLRRVTKEKRIGHCGTLDPFATGVLPVVIGKATRLIEYFNDDKEYIAEVTFGKNTDSYDIDGKVTEIFDKKISREEILSKKSMFEGEIFQTPPIYSAIKVNGKKLYEYAREGKTTNIEPRKIFIEKFELLNFDTETQKAEILISCSKGTYIRSIAYDLGKALGCGGYLSKLTRTKAGSFRIENSNSLEFFKTKDDVISKLQEPQIDMPKISLNEEQFKKISMGQFLKNDTNFEDGNKLVLLYNNRIVSIAQIKDNQIKACKVL